jgi:hypothetical protein
MNNNRNKKEKWENITEALQKDALSESGIKKIKIFCFALVFS